ncbi:protein serine/threonine phosphatase 2C [Polyplosphaeria fusca]|uniref:Protein serine/threonine phosphatase 2C n=1 Tax=Polyplosphaeria fusca TaxID=682080 RepID=A0A9P4QW92_9PLEO|nr:protein serine/threonine phosphatase 2C [Polyplosphaeria fusca]
MKSIQWRVALRQLDRRRLLAPPIPQPQALRSYIRQACPKRVPLISRAPTSTSRMLNEALRGKNSTPKNTSAVPRGVVLQSAFPKKTVAAVVLLGGLVYWFVDVDMPPQWMIDMERPGAVQFFETKEEVEHWVEAHMPQPLDASTVEMMDQYIADWERLVGGFAMTEEEAREANMPVTHGAQAGVNEPCEDFYALGTAPGPGAHPWNYWAVYDGHAGKHTAAHLQMALIPHVSRDLSRLHESAPSPAITQCITQTFIRLDENWLATAKRAAHWYPALHASALMALAPVFSGSCALLAAFDPRSSTLRVACTGDSRAVLGRWDASSKTYTAVPLSVDQTGFNAAEVERLADQHPDEPAIIDPESGRLLGIAVTRAFGDHRWKWPSELVELTRYKFFGPAPRPGNASPPYMTAEPVVTETQVQRRGDGGGKPDFLILASDGLWDKLSSENAVHLVDRWIATAAGNRTAAPADQRSSSMQLDPGVHSEPQNATYPTWDATPEYFSIEDENAAVCLMRNAFGGNRRGLFKGVMSVPGGLARQVVDDTTVLVVFFGEVGGKKGGKRGEKKKGWWRFW